MQFKCGRTCRVFERCRFTPVLSALGRGQTAFSHTAHVKVDFHDLDVLARCITEMGGKVLGHGEYKLYSSTEQGWGFTLPGWQYPLIVTEGASLSYDNYAGMWGKLGDVETLRRSYTIECAAAAAAAQGWYCERQGESLVVYHPAGGTLTVTPDGVCDAMGIVGAGCHVFEAIESALGQSREVTLKPEYFAERANVRATE